MCDPAAKFWVGVKVQAPEALAVVEPVTTGAELMVTVMRALGAAVPLKTGLKVVRAAPLRGLVMEIEVPEGASQLQSPSDRQVELRHWPDSQTKPPVQFEFEVQETLQMPGGTRVGEGVGEVAA